jgi:vacuolar-type H+-ATPase subunit I/STV1
MANVWDVLQQIVAVTRHVEELQADIKQQKHDLELVKDRVADRLRAVEVDVATLTAGQQVLRETVRSEVALAMADLRVRFAEE